MGIELRRKEITDPGVDKAIAYELTVFGTRQGNRVLLRVIKFIGTPLAELLSKGVDGFADAVQAFLKSATTDDLDYLIDQFSERCVLVLHMTTKAGQKEAKIKMSDPGQYDRHFGQSYTSATAWLVWCIKENFTDFFGDKGLVGMLNLARDQSQSESPTEQTGSPGES